MSTVTRIVAVLVLAAFAGGAVLMAAWEPQPPTARVEKVISNDRLGR